MNPSPLLPGAALAAALISCLAPELQAIPFNDHFEFAADLGSSSELIRQSDPRVASLEEFENSLDLSHPEIPNEIRSGSLWFRWTAPSAGNYFLLELEADDLLDVYRSSSGNLGANIAADEETGLIHFSATAGEVLYFRHSAWTSGPFGFPFSFGESAPSGFILRREGNTRVTDLGARDGYSAFFTSFGAANSEKYRWTIPQSGSYRLFLSSFSDPEEPLPGTASLSRNGTPVAEFAFLEPLELDLAAGDVMEITLTGDLWFAPFTFVPVPPAADLGSVTSITVPSVPDEEWEWTWTAPSDGYLTLEWQGHFPFSDVFFADPETFAASWTQVNSQDSDALTLGRRCYFSGKVSAGKSYIFSDVFNGPGDLLTGCIKLKFFATPSTVDERLAAVSAELGLSTNAGLLAADTHLAAVLSAEPTNAHASAFRAFTRLALLESEPAYASFLQSLGVTATGPGFFRPGYQVTEAEDGLPEFPEEANATERIAAFKLLVSPRLAEIRSLLNTATASGDRRSYVAKTEQSYVIDQADILAMKASVDIVQALLDLLSVYDLGGSLNAIVQLERDGELDLEQAMAQIPSLLQVANSAAIADFKTRINNANTLLGAALIQAAGQRTSTGSHVFPPVGLLGNGKGLLEFMEGSEVLGQAFNGPVKVGEETIDLSQWNTGTGSLRSFLPTLKGNYALGLTAADPSFGGIFPGQDKAGFDRLLEKHGILADPSGFSTWIQGFLEQGLPPYLMGFMDDADGDGDTNGEEYYFASNPADPSVRVQSPVASLDVGPGGKEFRTSFVRRIGSDSEIRYVAAVSDDMKTWDYTGAQVSQVGAAVPVGDGEGEVITVAIDADLKPHRFIRIHAVAR